MFFRLALLFALWSAYMVVMFMS